MNVAEHVARVASEDPNRVALVASHESWTYRELLSSAAAQQTKFASLGVVAGDRVALLLPNSVTFVLAYLACVRAGYVPVPINPSLTEDEIRHMLDDSSAAAAVVLNEFAGKIANTTYREHVIRLGRTITRPELDPASQGAVSEPVDLDAAHPATLLYTSGTTGRPKGALLSHHNTIFTARSKVHYLDLHQDDVLLLYLPLYHCYGLNAVLNPGLLAGATIVLAERFERNQILALVNNHSVTRLFAVPHIFRLLLDSRVTPESIPTVRYALSAGDMLPDDVQQRWSEHMGWPIHQAYGLTETSPFVTYNHTPGLRPGSVGTAIDGVEIAVRRESGKEASCGETGEVWVRGPNVMLGYWNSPEATADAIVDGWLRTADHGRLDEDGFLYLAGRSSEVIIVAGQNVYAAEVERVLLADDNVTDATVYGVRHEFAGEIVCASVVAAGTEASASGLRAMCARNLGAHKVPVAIDIVESLPTLKTGKKDRKALAAMAHERWNGRSAKDSPL